MLSHVKARSSTVTWAVHPGSRGPRAACRLLQSITIDEHNRLIDRTPLTARGVAPRRSFNRSPSVGLRRLLSSCGTGWPSSCSKLSQPRCHGSGARHEDHPCLLLSPRSLVIKGVFPNPIGSDTSRRERASTQTWRCPRRRRSSMRIPTCPPGKRLLSQDLCRSGSPLASPREREHNPPHPRCLPSISFPEGWGSRASSPAVASSATS
jgi:hypothetical protein